MKNISKLLKRHGLRLTKQRQVIFSAVNSHPKSAQEIFLHLKNTGFKTDKVTIYRTLDTLTHLGLLTKTLFQDQVAKYELKTSHHHHIVCDECGQIEDIKVEEHPIISKISHQTKFQITNHNLEFFGLCPNCQI